ncbi:hypothetical protein C1H46_038792 [Malus baccata]|uniref:Uncharacterized protein n=1 Tax=Malus baccata TaxID=106549 RepID=A0A540KN85_MALBA|nr:hypothetical protein C1H46_038792 [Malus baccata]
MVNQYLIKDVRIKAEMIDGDVQLWEHPQSLCGKDKYRILLASFHPPSKYHFWLICSNVESDSNIRLEKLCHVSRKDGCSYS